MISWRVPWKILWIFIHLITILIMMGTLSFLKNLLKVLFYFDLCRMDYWRHKTMCVCIWLVWLYIFVILVYFWWDIFHVSFTYWLLLVLRLVGILTTYLFLFQFWFLINMMILVFLRCVLFNITFLQVLIYNLKLWFMFIFWLFSLLFNY